MESVSWNPWAFRLETNEASLASFLGEAALTGVLVGDTNLTDRWLSLGLVGDLLPTWGEMNWLGLR